MLLATGPMVVELYSRIDGARLRLASFTLEAEIRGRLGMFPGGRIGFIDAEIAPTAIGVRNGLLLAPGEGAAAVIAKRFAEQLVPAVTLGWLPPLPSEADLPEVNLEGGYLVFSR